jgi:electron transfer flavoprotein alpha subunit
LIGDAKKLAAQKKTAVELILPSTPEHSAGHVAELGPHEPACIHLFEHPSLSPYTTDTYLAVLENFLGTERFFLLLVAATANGRDLAARLAARAGIGYVPHALTFRASGSEKLEVTRVSHGGRVHVQSIWATGADGGKLLVTMRPGVADVAATNHSAGVPKVVRHAVRQPPRQRVWVREHLPADPQLQDLRDAERIVAGGRGVGGADGFAVVRDLADALHASVGASRVAVDLGWIPYERQVGQTGKSVAPQLYFAVGISGASHHLMGMQGSETIVAVNTDRKAPIFRVAHFGVVGDLHAILPALAQRIRENQPPAEPWNKSPG